ncbi:hypothetical protein RF11_09765 [Thelohanellus kitauei]|uniref:39S ribosomal protein L52, mitochondrial n=1 Tax=Thelohanellus kitauei TaxID=669202 RepID=A0A0C2INA8_THEKT|nr:hypothetical protein RF11_09765 [Thelohanellus kitauei]
MISCYASACFRYGSLQVFQTTTRFASTHKHGIYNDQDNKVFNPLNDLPDWYHPDGKPGISNKRVMNRIKNRITHGEIALEKFNLDLKKISHQAYKQNPSLSNVPPKTLRPIQIKYNKK